MPNANTILSNLQNIAKFSHTGLNKKYMSHWKMGVQVHNQLFNWLNAKTTDVHDCILDNIKPFCSNILDHYRQFCSNILSNIANTF